MRGRGERERERGTRERERDRKRERETERDRETHRKREKESERARHRERWQCARPTWTWEEEMDLLHVDMAQAARNDTAEQDYEDWVAQQAVARGPTTEENLPAPTQRDPPTPPTSCHPPPGTEGHNQRSQPDHAIPCYSSDEETMAAVREWELENGAMEAHTVVRVTKNFDVVSLMQAVNPTHALIQRLQDILERQPLLRQATRCRMLQHRLHEWLSTNQPAPEATSLQALLTVYQQEVPPHKMYPTDEDHEFVRMWWQDMERALPAQPLGGESIEVDSQTPCQTGNFTHLTYQHEYAQQKQAAEAARAEEEKDLAESMARNATHSGESAQTAPTPEPPTVRVELQQVTADGHTHALQSIQMPAGESLRLQFQVVAVEMPTNQQGAALVPHPSTPLPTEDAPLRTQGSTQLYPEHTDAQDERAPATILPTGGETVFAFSALPPTLPRSPFQRNLHQVGGMRPSPKKHDHHNASIAAPAAKKPKPKETATASDCHSGQAHGPGEQAPTLARDGEDETAQALHAAAALLHDPGDVVLHDSARQGGQDLPASDHESERQPTLRNSTL